MVPKSELAAKGSVFLHARTVFSYYSFFMAFPAIVIVQNLSVFIFPFLLKAWSGLGVRIFAVRHNVQILAILFGVGAIASVLAMPKDYSPNSLSNALAVLPNYLYWAFLLIVMTNARGFIFMNLVTLYRIVFFGVVCSCVYYFVFFPGFLGAIPVFKRITQNAFAFLLICFSPMATYYCLKRYGASFGIGFTVVMVLLGFLSGSRSGSILVLLGNFAVLIVKQIRLRNILSLLSIVALAYLVIFEVSFTRTVIQNLNSRTHDFIYENETVLRTDRSYLVRVAMIEKALVIHEEYPLTGVGLNNFANYDVVFPGNFAGSEFVLQKSNINETSAHNSYVGLLAEGGLLLLIPFLLIMLYCLISFVRALDRMPQMMKPVFICLICMSIHLYFIMAIVNVFAWFLLGLACAFSVLVNSREIRVK